MTAVFGIVPAPAPVFYDDRSELVGAALLAARRRCLAAGRKLAYYVFVPALVIDNLVTADLMLFAFFCFPIHR
ncbi:MAG: hypothetical protein O6909_03015 [Alphaproteobacteria bacterium]|nr:hypothetical protein [Alphaproteobacteria bacterium]